MLHSFEEGADSDESEPNNAVPYRPSHCGTRASCLLRPGKRLHRLRVRVPPAFANEGMNNGSLQKFYNINVTHNFFWRHRKFLFGSDFTACVSRTGKHAEVIMSPEGLLWWPTASFLQLFKVPTGLFPGNQRSGPRLLRLRKRTVGVREPDGIPVRSRSGYHGYFKVRHTITGCCRTFLYHSESPEGYGRLHTC